MRRFSARTFYRQDILGIKDFNTNEALEQERSRRSGVFSVHMQEPFSDQHYFQYEPNGDTNECEPDTVTILSVGQFEEVPLEDHK